MKESSLYHHAGDNAKKGTPSMISRCMTMRSCRWRILLLSIMVLFFSHVTPTAALLMIPMSTIPDPIVHFGIGAVAGGCGAIAYQPFDYIKAQLQLPANSRTNGLQLFIDTFRQNPRNLYKGIVVAVTGVAPEKSIKLGVNDILRDVFASSQNLVVVAGVATSQTTTLPLWCQITAGAVAGACQVVVSSPLDVIKVHLQTQTQTRPPESKDDLADANPKHPVIKAWEEVTGGPEGIRALYKGVGACLIRDISFTAVCFPSYSTLVASGSDPFVAGALSGMVSTFIATPADMVKTRILTSSSSGSYYSKSSDSIVRMNGNNLLQSGRMTIQEDGTLTAAASLVTLPTRNDTVSMLSSSALDDTLDDYSKLLVYDTTKDDKKGYDNNANSLWVAKTIIDQEGVDVLFRGVYERCVGAVPRFGITLGVHEWLEHYASHVGLLSSGLPSS